MHYRKMFDPKQHLCAADLEGRDVTLEIARVSKGEVEGEKGLKNRKPIVSFKESKRTLVLNVTMCRVLNSMFGSAETDDWENKRITLYPTTTDLKGEKVECIRIRPTLPPPASKKDAQLKPDDAPEVAA